MASVESVDSDDEIPELAVKALNDAQLRARETGRPIVLVVKDQLVQVSSTGSTILGNLPPRLGVAQRVKRAQR